MLKIKSIKAREILSSGGQPTIEVKIILNDGSQGKASVPFGASAGKNEAFLLLDQDKKRYLGCGQLKAVQLINQKISKKLVGQQFSNQNQFDQKLLALDPTPNKKNLGGNTILACSIAFSRAMAASKKIPLYQYLRKSFNLPLKKYILPQPLMVLIEGGRHADNSTDFQEYLIAPKISNKTAENIRAGEEIYLNLKKILNVRKLNTNVGNEGAFAPALKNNFEPFNLLAQAIKKSGYSLKQIGLGLDAAASEFYQSDKYALKKEKKNLSAQELVSYYSEIFKKYKLVYLEDALSEDDWQNWPKLFRIFGKKLLVCGDDLTTTNLEILKKAVKAKIINSMIIKPNQIGSISETMATIKYALKNKIELIVSHRGGGETADSFIIDLAVAVNAKLVKIGPTRGERTEKYNRLMEIEEEVMGNG